MMRYSLGVMGVFLFACQSPPDSPVNPIVDLHVPRHFPEMVIPLDNPPTLLGIELGRKLFYDKRLSGDGSTSCASCHLVSSAFTDGKMTSEGFNGKFGKRNAPTLANVGWLPRLMSEGGVPSLEMQVLAPSIDTNEMNFNLGKSADLLRADEELNRLSWDAYQRDLDAYVIVRAVASFERTFISGDSRYDRAVYLHTDSMTDEEIAGMNLFFSARTNCSSCHAGVFFTDDGYYNVGLYDDYQDKGRQRVTYSADDIGKFKVPTLRNIELTAPYMHDGSLNTLEDVIDFFNSGGAPHPNKDARIHPLLLNTQEKKELVAFLKTLTDWNFVQNVSYLPTGS